MTECPGCGITFEKRSKKQIYCCKPCGTKIRQKGYKHQYTYVHRGKNPKNFIRSLLHKKVRKDLSLEYMMSLWDAQDGKCALTGLPMTYTCGEGRIATNVSIDQIEASQGYVPGNVQLVCRAANHMKWNYSIPEMVSWCKAIVDHHAN